MLQAKPPVATAHTTNRNTTWPSKLNSMVISPPIRTRKPEVPDCPNLTTSGLFRALSEWTAARLNPVSAEKTRNARKDQNIVNGCLMGGMRMMAAVVVAS